MSGAITYTAIGCAAVLGFSVSYTANDFAEAPMRNLVLEELRYNGDGTVTQRLSGDIPADWAANIVRVSNGMTQVLCTGQGIASGIYIGSEDTYSTDVWTGADCPALISGDVGKASWTYKNEHGFTVTTIGQFVVG